MTLYTIRVSQRVFYDVQIEAHSPVEALREVGASLDRATSDPGPTLDDYQPVECDSGSWEIEPVQLDADGQPYSDDAFLSELVRIING